MQTPTGFNCKHVVFMSSSGLNSWGLASKINAASQTHTCSHTNEGVGGGHASLITLSDVKDTQMSFMSVTLGAEENPFFFFRITDCIVVSGRCNKEPFQHLAWDRLSMLSTNLCLVTPYMASSSSQNSCIPPLTLIKSRRVGLGSLAHRSLPWKGSARGVTTGRNGD